MTEKKEKEETPFNHGVRVDVAQFVHQRVLCNFPVRDACLERRKCNMQLIRAESPGA